MKEKIKWISGEVLNTFSNKNSFFSSKRLERFLVFISMLSLTVFFVIKSIISCTLGATDFIIIIGTWLGYGGWTTTQISKDKKIETENNLSDEETTSKDLLKG
jgi:hypothetical protein